MRVAIFTDNDFRKVNGVTTTLRAVLAHAPGHVHARIYTCESADVDRPGYLALRARGIGTVVVTLDAAAFERVLRAERERAGEVLPPIDPVAEEQRAQRSRALRHALSEYELKVHTVAPGQILAEALVG